MDYEVVTTVIFAVFWAGGLGLSFTAKDRNITMFSLFGAAFVMLGLMALMGFMTPGGLRISRTMVSGIFLTSLSIRGFYWPLLPGLSRPEEWLFLVSGVVCILWAMFLTYTEL